jgi:hypothetical protein
MKLFEIVKDRVSLEEDLTELHDKYTSESNKLISKINELRRLESLNKVGLDTDRIQKAETLIKVYGDIYTISEPPKSIAELAIEDIAYDCKHLCKEFYGNKRYESFYQRSDHQYGFGPKHGSIVDYIGLRKPNINLSDEDKNNCIYYLQNYNLIREQNSWQFINM